MKAIIWNRYGSADHLVFGDKDTPEIKDHEILIQVYASTVTAGDCEIRTLNFPLLLRTMLRLYFGIRRPRNIILGQELSGVVVAVGSKVSRFKVGDPVMGTSGFKLGGYGEFVALPEKTDMGILVKKPEWISFEEAAAMPVGGMEAFHLLKVGKVDHGRRILINGAGGSIGTAATQIAKAMGAHVTVVDAGEKLPMLQGLGADRVMDFRTTSYTKDKKTYDVVIDIVGKGKILKTFGALKPGGLFLQANPRFRHRLWHQLSRLSKGRRLIVDLASHREDAMEALLSLYQQGTLKIEIDQIFPLKDVPKAHQYVEDGHKKGNVVVSVKASL